MGLNDITLSVLDKTVDVDASKSTVASSPVDIHTPDGMITYDDATHTYTRNNAVYIPVNDLLGKYGYRADYAGIPTNVLANAAARGKQVHKDLELFIKTGTHGVGTIPEVDLFNQYVTLRMIDLTTAKSELVVFDDNYQVAGTVDFQYLDGNEDIIADFKTTSSLHLEAVSWQLSVYAYLITHGDIIAYYFKTLKVFHISNGKLQVKDIPSVDFDAVKGLLDAHKSNQTTYSYIRNTANIITPSEAIVLGQIRRERQIAEQQLNFLKQEEEKILERLMPSMVQHKQYVIETDDLKIRYVEPITKITYNKSKVDQLMVKYKLNKADYQNVTVSKGSVRVTLKDEADDAATDAAVTV